MKEKKRTEKTTAPGGDSSIFDGVPEVKIGNPNVSVSSGPYAEELPVAGSSVGEVRRKFSDRLDIDAKAQAIVNGKPQGEEYVLQAGEALMFVRHAGEKGGYVLEVKGGFVRIDGSLQSMPLPDLLERCGPGYNTGPVILPSGIKAILSRGPITIWFWEQPPRVHQLSWIAKDSEVPYGPGTKYRKVRIALPYLIIAAVFGVMDNGWPDLLLKDECFFRNEPLKSLDDELCYPALLNCSKFEGGVNNGNPLSWICTQYLKQTKLMNSPKPGDRFQGSFEAVRYCLLETSFNLSSEHHEANSWYGESKKIDPRIATVEAWEKNTEKDPLFVLDVPWIKTKHSVRQLAERIFKNNGQAQAEFRTADDLARVIINNQ